MPLSAVLAEEIASAATDPWYHIFSGIPYSPDATLFTLLGGDSDRYDKVLGDAHAKATIEARVRNVVLREWQFEAASSSKLDKKAAEVCKDIFGRFDSDQMTADLLETAFLKGNSFDEIGWAIDGRLTYVKTAIIRPTHRFKFVLPGVKEGIGAPIPSNIKRKPRSVGMYLGYEIRVLSIENDLIYGESVPIRRVLCHSYNRRADNPWGIGLGSNLYWLAEVFKKEVVKQRLIFLDKYADPTLRIKTKETTTKEQRRQVNQEVAGIKQGGSLVLPEGCEVDFLEASRSSTNDLFQSAIEYFNNEMSKMVLGETLSLELPNNSGSRAAAETHQDGSTIYLAKFDADRLSTGPLRELAEWITELNVPGARPPKIWKRFPELDEVEDLNGRVQRDSTLNSIGYKITAEKVKEVYGDGYEDTAAKQAEKQQEQSQQQQQDLGGASLGFSETRQIKAVDSADMEFVDIPEFRAVIHRVLKWGNHEIGLEYMPGETRFRGTKYARKLRSGYGHLRNYKGSDKEALDCYLAPAFFDGGNPSDRVFEVNQVNPETLEHDEQKMMVGYDDIDHAKNSYIQEMTPAHMGGIREILTGELEKYRKDKPQFSEADIRDLIKATVAEVIPNLKDFVELVVKKEVAESRPNAEDAISEPKGTPHNK